MISKEIMDITKKEIDRLKAKREDMKLLDQEKGELLVIN
jgi:hypothetical protein